MGDHRYDSFRRDYLIGNQNDTYQYLNLIRDKIEYNPAVILNSAINRGHREIIELVLEHITRDSLSKVDVWYILELDRDYNIDSIKCMKLVVDYLTM